MTTIFRLASSEVLRQRLEAAAAETDALNREIQRREDRTDSMYIAIKCFLRGNMIWSDLTSLPGIDDVDDAKALVAEAMERINANIREAG